MSHRIAVAVAVACGLALRLRGAACPCTPSLAPLLQGAMSSTSSG